MLNKKALVALGCAVIFAGVGFVACNEDKENVEFVKKSTQESESIDGHFVITKDGVDREILIVKGTIVSSTNSETGETTLMKQIVHVEEYSSTLSGEKAATSRMADLKNKYGMPCVASYYAYNKETKETVILVAYSMTEPCDWQDQL